MLVVVVVAAVKERYLNEKFTQHSDLFSLSWIDYAEVLRSMIVNKDV